MDEQDDLLNDGRKCYSGIQQRKPHPFNVALGLAFGFLLSSVIYFHWGSVWWARLSGYTGADNSPAQEKTTFQPDGRSLIALVTCLAILTMVSILHVRFKWPLFNIVTRNVYWAKPTPEQLDSRPVRQLSSPAEDPWSSGHSGGIFHLEDGPNAHLEQLTRLPLTIISHFDDVIAPLLADEQQQSSSASQKFFAGGYAEELVIDEANFDKAERQDRIGTTERAPSKSSKAVRVEDNVGDKDTPWAEADYDVAHSGTQTDDGDEGESRYNVSTIGTMTSSPERMNVSVNTHQRLCKIVKNCGTSTSGPFMKKLRRAQRLWAEAGVKMKHEKQEKVTKWRSVMDRYRDKLCRLFENLEMKDRLLGSTALSRALTENEVKEIYTAVRSSRDRLVTQCKLNSALKEVVESKSEVPPSASPAPHQQQPC